MRSTGFRGKSVKTGEWFYGDLQRNSIGDTWISELDCGEGDRGFFENVKCETVGEFTGMFDKNRKRIYEGDRLSTSIGTATVIFKDGCFWFVHESDSSLGCIAINWSDYDIEVIGNIHDCVL